MNFLRLRHLNAHHFLRWLNLNMNLKKLHRCVSGIVKVKFGIYGFYQECSWTGICVAQSNRENKFGYIIQITT